MKLDLACGKHGRSKYDGFFGVDAKPAIPDAGPYLQLDLNTRKDWPWPDGSADEVIVLHFIEHMCRSHGLRFVSRVLRVLKAGAHCTFATPDLRLLARYYLDRDEAFWGHVNARTGRKQRRGETHADQLNHTLHQAGHLWAYDPESLGYLITEACPTGQRHYPMPADSPYAKHPDHEFGIVMEKLG